MIVGFEDPNLGDASDELEKLGYDFATDVFIYLQKVVIGSVDFRTLAPFYTFNGIEMFQASMGSKFAIFAVEIDDMDDLTVTLMLAGEHGVRMTAGGHSWDGNSYASLGAGILKARASVWFT
ncbi:hypothetical protein QU42_19460 [Bradyrhizobium sp. UASWS1016]|jgi:hypothetical protein|uniref:hypothetical protein n=1 Tax=Bradyrhizobium sp. UASWS1016 TaxID=1566379 RepID=UPI000856B2B4|nr:hypothetical protein [Bradyrhizobium sp. UASWS1016]OCX29115.1 hypothetical protein QU42_19460 [Bradyrhizobium sp. UASWS1016]